MFHTLKIQLYNSNKADLQLISIYLNCIIIKCTLLHVSARNSHLQGDLLSICKTSKTGLDVQYKIKALLRNHCCHGKAIRVTYSEYVFVALVNRHTKRMRRIVLSSVGRLAVMFFHIISYSARFSKKKKKKLTEGKICFDFL